MEFKFNLAQQGWTNARPLTINGMAGEIYFSRNVANQILMHVKLRSSNVPVLTDVAYTTGSLSSITVTYDRSQRDFVIKFFDHGGDKTLEDVYFKDLEIVPLKDSHIPSVEDIEVYFEEIKFIYSNEMILFTWMCIIILAILALVINL